MTLNRFLLFLLLIGGFTGCQRDSDVLPGSATYDIVGTGYPNGVLPLHEGGVTIEAISRNYDDCDHTRILLGIDRALTTDAQLDLSFNFPAKVGYYTAYSTTGPWNLCNTDSVKTSISVGERPKPGSFDLMGLAAHQVIDEAGSYVEVTHYDENKRWIEGRFELRAVRVGVKTYPLPLSDTVIIANGKFGSGLKRE